MKKRVGSFDRASHTTVLLPCVCVCVLNGQFVSFYTTWTGSVAMKFFWLLMVVKVTMWTPLKLFQLQRLVNKLLPLTSGLLSTKRVSFFSGGQWSSNVHHLPVDRHAYSKKTSKIHILYRDAHTEKKLNVMYSSCSACISYWNTLLHAFISRKFNFVYLSGLYKD